MQRATTALIIVDMQIDFCNQKSGALYVPGAEKLPNIIANIVERGNYHTVVATQDWHPKDHMSFASNNRDAKEFDVVQFPYGDQCLWPDHCVQGTLGAAFFSESLRTDVIIRKGQNRFVDSYSGFRENDKVTWTGLGGYLSDRGVTHVDVVGVAFDYCVTFTACDATYRGFETRILREATAAINQNGSLEDAEKRLMTCGVKVV